MLLRQKRDEVPKGTLSCPDRIMEVFYQLRHYEGSHLPLSVCGQKLIQQTLFTQASEGLGQLLQSFARLDGGLENLADLEILEDLEILDFPEIPESPEKPENPESRRSISAVLPRSRAGWQSCSAHRSASCAPSPQRQRAHWPRSVRWRVSSLRLRGSPRGV